MRGACANPICWHGATKGGGLTNEFLVFTPDGKTFFTGMTNGDVKAILASIKAAE